MQRFRYVRHKSHPSLMRPSIQLTKRGTARSLMGRSFSNWNCADYVVEFPEFVKKATPLCCGHSCRCARLLIEFRIHFRYIQVHFKLITFDNLKKHPAHFKQVVSTNTLGLQLMNIIREETALLTPQSLKKLFIFKDKSYHESALIPEDKTLRELGYEGGTKELPDKLDLFYDFKIEFRDCSLLSCDHYFGKKFQADTIRTPRAQTILS